MKRLFAFTILLVSLGIACSLGAPTNKQRETMEEAGVVKPSRSSLEAAAEAAFEVWAQQISTPYRNIRYGVIENDGTFATVRIIAEFRKTAQSAWTEHFADLECRKVGAKWQCDQWLDFQLSAKARTTQQAQLQATRTAAQTATAQRRAQLEETAIAEAISATATRQAEVNLIKLIKVVGVDSVEYILEETSCPGGLTGCKKWGVRRITFSVENSDTQNHSVEIEITIADYISPASNYVERVDYETKATWQGIAKPGKHQITFDHNPPPRLGTFFYKMTQFYFESGSGKVLSVDGRKNED